MSYCANAHWMWGVSGRDQIQGMWVDEEDKGCLGKGCSDSREMYGSLVGASIEGELHLSWMQMFPSPFMPFIFIFIVFS
jgi:hypothetical protein